MNTRSKLVTALAGAGLCLTLAACSEQKDSRAVVGLDRHNKPIYATPAQQAEFDRERKDNELLSSVARGNRRVDSLSPEERAVVGAALKGK